MKRPLLILMAVILLIGIVVAANIDTKQTQKWVGMNVETELRYGSLYGAARLLEAYGHPNVHNHAVVYNLNDKNITYADNDLMLITSHEGLTAEHANQLNAWVKRGNTLVIAANQAGEFQSELLDHFNIRISHPETPSDSTQTPDNLPRIPVAPSCQKFADTRQQQLNQTINPEYLDRQLQDCSYGINLIRLPEDRQLALYIDSEVSFSTPKSKHIWFQGNGQHGTGILALQHGHGRIVISESLGFFRNPYIPSYNSVGRTLLDHDHAYLLAYLAQGRDNVHLIHKWQARKSLHQPSWLQLLRQQPTATILLLATLIFGTWHLTRRVGPVRSLPPAPERSLNRHLLAQGRFLIQHINKRALLQQLQQELFEECQTRHHGWQHMGLEQRLQVLARQTQLPPSTLRVWLEPIPQNIGNPQWLHMLQIHRQIRHNSRRHTKAT